MRDPHTEALIWSWMRDPQTGALIWFWVRDPKIVETVLGARPAYGSIDLVLGA